MSFNITIARWSTEQQDCDGGDGGMGVQEYRACLHRRLLFTLLMISMLGSINISVAGSSIVNIHLHAVRRCNDLGRIAGEELKNQMQSRGNRPWL